MIVADPKPLDEVFGFIRSFQRVLVLGCGECVTVCQVGGEKEVSMLAQALRLKARVEKCEVEFVENTVRRQCDREFVEPILAGLDETDAILSVACGVGVNFIAELHPTVPVFPAVDTTFMGATMEHGRWAEMCAGCGRCILELTGGICPIARCAKSILNGPCGGTQDGMCELSTPESPVECVWSRIIARCTNLGTLDRLAEYVEPKDWSTSRHGGPRERVRVDLLLEDDDGAPAPRAGRE